MEHKRSIEQLEATLQELDISIEYIDVANALSFELLAQHRDTERAYALATETFHLCMGQFSEYKKGLAEALLNWSRFFQWHSDIKKSIRYAMQAGEICQELGDADLLIRQVWTLQWSYRMIADWNRALSSALDYLRLAQEHGRTTAEALATETIATAYADLGEYDQAITYYKKSLAILNTLDDKPRCAIAHLNITRPYRYLGDYDQALYHAEMAYDFLRGSMSNSEAIILGIFGHIYTDIGQYDRAMAYHQQKLKLADALDRDYLHAYTYSDIGKVYLAMGQTEKAVEWLESGTQLAEKKQVTDALLLHYEPLIQAYKANHELDQALTTFEKLAALRAERQNTAAINQRSVLMVIHETEQAQLEAQLHRERAERLRVQAENLATQNAMFQKINTLKDELVATASHDMRNPLTAMSMELSMLDRLIQGNPKAQRYINRLQKNVTHVTHLIEDLLDFSDIESLMLPQLAPTDLTALVAEAIVRQESRCRAKQIDLQADLPADPLDLPLDAHQFERVLDNLMGNAVKYTGEGGKVRVHLSVADGQAVLSVRDTGRGIPADEIPRVFDSRFRASNSGSEQGDGHGLSIVQDIVKSHQGTIVCESVLGEGTAFIIHLPFLSLS